MTKQKKYTRFIILVIIVIAIVVIFGLDEDRTIINGIRYALKGILRAL